jgi:hypothetical protein
LKAGDEVIRQFRLRGRRHANCFLKLGEAGLVPCNGGWVLNYFLVAVLLVALVLILGRLHSYYLDENERIAKGLRGADDY